MTGRMVVLDTETTGLDPKQGHRLTEIGCVELMHREPTGEIFHAYLNPERDLDARAAEITGLTWAFLSDKPLFKDIAEAFLQFIAGAELIIHNAAFDLGFLNQELSAIQYEHLPLQAHFSVIDTLVLAKKKHPGPYNLDALCLRHGVDNTHRAEHGALKDAQILTEVYRKLTAGQIALDFEGQAQEEALLGRNQAVLGVAAKAGHQSKTFSQKVVYATAAEIDRHEARLKSLAGKNSLPEEKQS